MNSKQLTQVEAQYLRALGYCVLYQCDLTVAQFAAAHELDWQELEPRTETKSGYQGRALWKITLRGHCLDVDRTFIVPPECLNLSHNPLVAPSPSVQRGT